MYHGAGVSASTSSLKIAALDGDVQPGDDAGALGKDICPPVSGNCAALKLGNKLPTSFGPVSPPGCGSAPMISYHGMGRTLLMIPRFVNIGSGTYGASAVTNSLVPWRCCPTMVLFNIATSVPAAPTIKRPRVEWDWPSKRAASRT